VSADAGTRTAFQPPEALQPVLTGLRERFPEAVRQVSGHRGEVTVELDPAHLVEVATWLRDHPAARFRLLADLSGTDYLKLDDRPERLCVDYHLYSFDHNTGYPQRKDYPLGGVDVEYIDAHVPSPDTRRYKGGWTST